MPGPITGDRSVGCNRLIRDGATPLLELRDLLEHFPDATPPQGARSMPPSGARAPLPESLGPTERRVAELAASGMTNKDVATALFISPKTVEANLVRIYRKLGIKTRAELGRIIGDI